MENVFFGEMSVFFFVRHYGCNIATLLAVIPRRSGRFFFYSIRWDMQWICWEFLPASIRSPFLGVYRFSKKLKMEPQNRIESNSRWWFHFFFSPLKMGRFPF